MEQLSLTSEHFGRRLNMEFFTNIKKAISETEFQKTYPPENFDVFEKGIVENWIKDTYESTGGQIIKGGFNDLPEIHQILLNMREQVLSLKGVTVENNQGELQEIFVLEKAKEIKQVGQTKVGSDGVTRVWTQLPNGKYDWRRKKASSDDTAASKTDSSKQPTIADLESKTPGYLQMPERNKYIQAKNYYDQFGPANGFNKRGYDNVHQNLVDAAKNYKAALLEKQTPSDKEEKIEVGKIVSIKLNGTEIKGELKSITPLKIKTDATSVMTLPNHLFDSLKLEKQTSSLSDDGDDITSENKEIASKNEDKELKQPEKEDKRQVLQARNSKKSWPSSIQEYLKDRGSHIKGEVNKVNGWLHSLVGRNFVGGTSLGKHHDSLVLNVIYEGGEVYVDEDGNIEVNGEKVNSKKEFENALKKKFKLPNEENNESSSDSQIQKANDNEIEKGGEVMDTLYYGDKSITFSKTGSDIKLQLTKVKDKETFISVELKTKMNLILEELPFAPTENYYDCDIKTFKWELTYQKDNNSNVVSFNDIEQGTITTEQSELCRRYNDMAWSYRESKKELSSINLLEQNLDDEKSYELTARQMLAFGF